MVKKENLVYLFIGQDSHSKNIRLKQIKEEFLPPETQDFNLDTLYAKELNLKTLQERLLSLPVKAKKRMIVIKEAQSLKEDIKNFMVKYVRKPYSQIILILDADHFEYRDEFINGIARYVQVYRLSAVKSPDTFTLSRQIDLKKPAYALRVLNQLLQKGEKPERILGGLRYTWTANSLDMSTKRKKLKSLLNCDIDIKRGRLKPDLALEKLVIGLCGGLSKP